jgi:hypothetical protein
MAIGYYAANERETIFHSAVAEKKTNCNNLIFFTLLNGQF